MNRDFEFDAHSTVAGFGGIAAIAVGAVINSALDRRREALAAGDAAMLDVVVNEWVEAYGTLQRQAEKAVSDRDQRIRELEAELAETQDRLFSITVIWHRIRQAGPARR